MTHDRFTEKAIKTTIIDSIRSKHKRKYDRVKERHRWYKKFPIKLLEIINILHSITSRLGTTGKKDYWTWRYSNRSHSNDP